MNYENIIDLNQYLQKKLQNIRNVTKYVVGLQGYYDYIPLKTQKMLLLTGFPIIFLVIVTGIMLLVFAPTKQIK